MTKHEEIIYVLYSFLCYGRHCGSCPNYCFKTSEEIERAVKDLYAHKDPVLLSAVRFLSHTKPDYGKIFFKYVSGVKYD